MKQKMSTSTVNIYLLTAQNPQYMHNQYPILIVRILIILR